MKSCHHENADHLMPGEWFQPWTDSHAPIVAGFEQFRCLDCGAWLSLGPSSDAGVEHEIRAAEIAASPEWMTIDELVGWSDRYDGDAERPGTIFNVGQVRAGYLAKCIVEHKP